MKGTSLEIKLNKYVDEIEDQIDLRYESFVESLDRHRSECKSILFKFKEDLDE